MPHHHLQIQSLVPNTNDFPECFVNKAIQYEAFGVWYLSFSIIQKMINVVVGYQNFIPMDVCLFTHSPVKPSQLILVFDDELLCEQSLHLGIYPEVKLLRRMANECVTL